MVAPCDHRGVAKGPMGESNHLRFPLHSYLTLRAAKVLEFKFPTWESELKLIGLNGSDAFNLKSLGFHFHSFSQRFSQDSIL